jgi:hypothetical protein
VLKIARPTLTVTFAVWTYVPPQDLVAAWEDVSVRQSVGGTALDALLVTSADDKGGDFV